MGKGEQFKMKKEEKIKGLIGEIVKEMLGENVDQDIKDKFNKAINQECEISIKKGKDGVTHSYIMGSNLAILITLAGLEQAILNKLGCSESMYEMVKRAVGTEEVVK